MTSPGRALRWTLLGAVLVLVIGGFLLLRGSGDDSGDDSSAGAGPTSSTASPQPSSSATGGTASARPSASGSPSTKAPAPRTPSPSMTPAPQRRTKKAVSIDAPARVNARTVVRVVGTRSVQGKAELPGEIGGPAVAVQISVDATSRTSLTDMVVNLYYGPRKTPAVPLTSGTRPLTGSVAAGSSRRGTYVFLVPRSSRQHVVISCDLTATQPVVVFAGAVD